MLAWHPCLGQLAYSWSAEWPPHQSYTRSHQNGSNGPPGAWLGLRIRARPSPWLRHDQERARPGMPCLRSRYSHVFSYLLCKKTTNSAPKATHNHVLFAVTHIYSVCMQWPFQCYFHTGDIGVNVLWIYHHCSLENIWTNSPYCPVLRDCLLLCLAEPWSLCEQVRVKFPDAAISPTSASSFLYVQRSTGLFLAFKGCACSFS